MALVSRTRRPVEDTDANAIRPNILEITAKSRPINHVQQPGGVRRFADLVIATSRKVTILPATRQQANVIARRITISLLVKRNASLASVMQLQALALAATPRQDSAGVESGSLDDLAQRVPIRMPRSRFVVAR